MQKIIKNLKGNEKLYYINIFLLITIISYTLIRIFNIKYSVPDDYLLNNIIAGTFGEKYDDQLLYINNILGKIFKILFYINKYINFYSTWLILTISISFTFITGRIIKKGKYILLVALRNTL